MLTKPSSAATLGFCMEQFIKGTCKHGKVTCLKTVLGKYHQREKIYLLGFEHHKENEWNRKD